MPRTGWESPDASEAEAGWNHRDRHIAQKIPHYHIKASGGNDVDDYDVLLDDLFEQSEARSRENRNTRDSSAT